MNRCAPFVGANGYADPSPSHGVDRLEIRTTQDGFADRTFECLGSIKCRNDRAIRRADRREPRIAKIGGIELDRPKTSGVDAMEIRTSRQVEKGSPRRLEARGPRNFDREGRHPLSGSAISAEKDFRMASESWANRSHGFAPPRLRFGRVSQCSSAIFPPQSSVRILRSFSRTGWMRRSATSN